MKTRDAVLLTITLFVIGSLIRFQIAGTGVPLIYFVVLGTSLWGAIDSGKLQLRDDKSPISYGPVVLFLGLLLLWLIAFPWYLSVRCRIRAGTVALKNGPENALASAV
jgi:hypothetical protein